MQVKSKFNNYLYPNEIINELITYKSIKKHKKSNLPMFVFLCGKGIGKEEVESNRNTVIQFFKNRTDLHFIYAENLWSNEKGKQFDLLTYEHFLAKLSDWIILFVESYGSACELGAFASRDELATKMLVVIDKKFKSSKSFIIDGPIKKLAKKNKESIAYTDLSAILSSQEMFSKLETFTSKKVYKINNDQSNIDLRSFILEYFDLINLLGPISSYDLVYVYKLIKEFDEFDKQIKVKYVIDILKRFNFIKEEDGLLSSIQQTDYQPFMFDITKYHYFSLRSKILARKYKYGEGSTA